MNRFKNAYILCGVLAIMVGLAYWDEWQTAKDEKAQSQRNLAFSIDKAAITKVEFINRDKDFAAIFERQGEGWQIMSPMQGAADTNAVEGLIQTIAEYKYEKAIATDPARWDEFSLKNPSRVVKLSDAQGQQTTIFIGKKAPVGYSAYFRKGEGPEVYIGSQHILVSTAKSLFEFRDKSFVKIKAEAVAELSYFVGDELVVEASRQQGTPFAMTFPDGVKGDAAELVDLIADFSTLKAQAFNDDPSTELQQQMNQATAKLSLKLKPFTGDQTTIKVASAAGKFWARINDEKAIYEISSEAMKTLTKGLIDFRDRSFVNAKVADITAVELNGVKYQLKGSDFVLVNQEAAGPKLHIQNLVADLVWAKAEKFLDLGEGQSYLAKEAVNTVVLVVEGEAARRVTIKSWTNADGGFVVKSSDSPDFVVVSEAVFLNTRDGDEGISEGVPDTALDLDEINSDEADDDQG